MSLIVVVFQYSHIHLSSSGKGEVFVKRLKSSGVACILASAMLFFSSLSESAPILLESGGYSSFADSPFYGNTLNVFYLEDFEDGLFNTPGVTAVANTPGVTPGVYSGQAADSVDGDDGAIDGSGSAGHSLAGIPNVPAEDLGFTFSFDAAALGGLPTHAGIVWTDGGHGVSTQFEAFDADGVSLGVIGPVQTGDNSWYGTTAEDHFFGVIYDGGILGFTIRDPGGVNNLEVDHLQYGRNAAVPEPGVLPLLGSCLVVLTGYNRRRKGGSLNLSTI